MGLQQINHNPSHATRSDAADWTDDRKLPRPHPFHQRAHNNPPTWRVCPRSRHPEHLRCSRCALCPPSPSTASSHLNATPSSPPLCPQTSTPHSKPSL